MQDFSKLYTYFLYYYKNYQKYKIKKHLNEDNEYVSFDKKRLKVEIKRNLKQQQFNNTQEPFAIHYKDEMEKDNILNFINDTIMEDTKVIDMSDYTNAKDFMYLIKDFADNDDVLLIFDLNTEIPSMFSYSASI